MEWINFRINTQKFTQIPNPTPPVIPQGGTQIFGRTGMCRSNGSLFYKKSLNMGPVFYQKILKHGSTFLNELKFSGFHMAKTPKIAKFLKNGPIFQAKILENGYPFLPKSPLKMGRGFEARAAHPCPTQIWVPPPGVIHPHLWTGKPGEYGVNGVNYCLFSSEIK